MKRTDIVMTPFLQSFLACESAPMGNRWDSYRAAELNYYQDLKLDLYLPKTPTKQIPLIIVIYGGGWVSGSRRDQFIEPMIEPVLAGYAVAVVDYTLGLDACYPKAVQDVLYSISYLKEHSQEYGIDKANITLWGESAGGHLDLLAGLCDPKEFGVLKDCSVKNIISYYPLTDVMTVDTQAQQLHLPEDWCHVLDGVYGVFLGPHKEKKEDLLQSSPITHIHQGMPNILLEHGTADTLIPYLQSQEFYNQVKQKFPQQDITLHLYEGKEHADDFFFTSKHIQTLLEWMVKR